MRVTEYEFHKSNGYRILGKLYMPDEEGPHPTAIFGHGFGVCMEDFKHHAPGFTEAGINFFLFDFCGGGPKCTSDGTLLEMSTVTEVEEMEVVLLELRKLPQVDADHIFLMGESQGGLVAALVGAAHPEQVKALCLWYPAFNIPDYVHEHCPEPTPVPFTIFDMLIGVPYSADVWNMDTYKETEAYHGDVLLIHGTDDHTVIPEYSVRAQKNYEHAELIMIPGARHGFRGADSDRVRAISIEFIMKHIS